MREFFAMICLFSLLSSYYVFSFPLPRARAIHTERGKKEEKVGEVELPKKLETAGDQNGP